MASYEEMWEVLSNHVFEIDSELSLHVKCIICNKLLNDAYMGSCGCSYCKKCIEYYLKDEEKYCPGDGSDCKLNIISINRNIVKDLTASKIISQFNVKCPEKLCSYRTTIIQMCDHLKCCEKTEANCPFMVMGCTKSSMERGKIVVHLQSDVLQHSNLMVEYLLNIKNEIAASKDSFQENGSRKDLEVLKHEINLQVENDYKIKDLIKNFQNELLSLKYQNENLTASIAESKIYSDIKIQNLTDANKKLEKELAQLRSFQKNECKQIKENQKKEIQKLRQEIVSLESKLNKKIDSNSALYSDQTANATDQRTILLDSESIEVEKQKKKKRPKNKPEVVPKEPQLIGTFVWEIPGISNSAFVMAGEHFFSLNKQYKMCLWFFPKGRDEFVDTHVSVEFDILDAPGGSNSGWTFKGSIDVRIKNKQKTTTNDGILVSERCTLNRSKRFQLIHFPNSDLKCAEVNLSDDFQLECFVNCES